MADKTKIEWADATVNAINGCTRVSPGCGGPGPHGGCYAERLAATRLRNHPSRPGLATMTSAGPRWTGKVHLHEPELLKPLRWQKPRRIFWNAHGDTFHEKVPDEWIDRVFAVCALSPQHIHMILTKRSARMLRYMMDKETRSKVMNAAMHIARDRRERALAVWSSETWPLPNVMLGVSVEDQTRADERREDFRATPAAVKFVSYEPALGPVDWTGWEFVQQIIGGGESGPKARPGHPDWFRNTRDWCADNFIAYFHKQNGEFAPGEIAGEYLDPEKPAKGLSYFDGRWSECWSEVDGHCDAEPDVYRIGKKAAGRLLDGVEHNGFPNVLA